MESQNHWRLQSPYQTYFSPSETFMDKNRLHIIQLSCWPKGTYRIPDTTEAVVRTIGCSSQTYGKAPLLQTTHIFHQIWRSLASAYLKPSPLLTSIYCTGVYCACHQRRKVIISPDTNPLIHHGDLSALGILVQQWHKCCGVTNHYMLTFKAPPMKWNPCLTMLWLPRM